MFISGDSYDTVGQMSLLRRWICSAMFVKVLKSERISCRRECVNIQLYNNKNLNHILREKKDSNMGTTYTSGELHARRLRVEFLVTF